MYIKNLELCLAHGMYVIPASYYFWHYYGSNSYLL